jgi:hypothetical protein
LRDGRLAGVYEWKERGDVVLRYGGYKLGVYFEGERPRSIVVYSRINLEVLQNHGLATGIDSYRIPVGLKTV